MNMEQKWFKAKEYGYGWYPATWQGWFVLAAWVAVNVGAFLYFDKDSHSNSDTIRPLVIFVLLTTLVLIYICKKTGEPARWRWGKDT